MRSYVGCIDLYGLRRFLLEDAVPKDLLRQLVQEWSSRTTTVVWAVVAEDNAETIRRELMADCRWTACNLLLNRAAELLFLVSVPDLAEPLT